MDPCGTPHCRSAVVENLLWTFTWNYLLSSYYLNQSTTLFENSSEGNCLIKIKWSVVSWFLKVLSNSNIRMKTRVKAVGYFVNRIKQEKIISVVSLKPWLKLIQNFVFVKKFRSLLLYNSTLDFNYK